MPNSAVKPLILVVEDDPAVRNLIVAALEAHGLRHMAVETAHAAIAAASSQAPSIALLDLGLPDMDGVKVVESVRAWSGMPIIVVSARSGDGLERLRERLLELAGWHAQPEGVFIARTRHVQALRRTREHLARAEALAAQGDAALDLLAEELRLAHDALGEITGAFTADDLLGEIFGRFCIGK